MLKVAGIVGVVGLALVLTACGGGSPQEKLMGACMRMNASDANASANCTCQVAKMKEKLTDSEMSDLADALNGIVDKANGNSEAAGQEIGARVMTGTLVNQKVGAEFLAASKACAVPGGGATPPAPAPVPAPAPEPAPAPAP